MNLTLLPGYDVELPAETQAPEWSLPLRPNLSVLSDIIVDSSEKADRALALLERLNIGAIAFDTEFNYRMPEVELRNGQTWHDPKALNPLVLSLAIWVPERGRVLRCAWDLRVKGINASLHRLFRLQTVFIAHFMQAELHTLWALGCDPTWHQFWDTWVAAKSLDLGKPKKAGFGLLALCDRYSVTHPYRNTKDHLQKQFLAHAEGQSFSVDQLDYAMADAEATLQIYLAQQSDILRAGLATHLHTVEFPFAVANARMVWDGVPIDNSRLSDLRGGLDNAIRHYRAVLAQCGLANPQSPQQVLTFLHGRGHSDHLCKDGKPSTSDDVLERLEHQDPIVSDIRRARSLATLRADPLFDGTLLGNDGRLHPHHRHLGADTGRSSCSAPNIAGISKTFRPIVAAPPGRALLELDYAQIEVCIAAAVHGDPDLLAAANSDDVYSAMAQIFYAGELSDEDLQLSPAAFKQARPELRGRMKVFVLGIIYGMSDRGIAERFGVSLSEAQSQQEAFFARFPGIAAAMRSSFENGRVRGSAHITGGLRRHIPASSKSRNQHINTPVQGTAGVVFRRAVASLYQHFRCSDAQIVLPIHDAILIECGLDGVDKVAAAAAFIMRQAVRQYFPELNITVDVNALDTSCWNKDGRADSLQAFIADPVFKL